MSSGSHPTGYAVPLNSVHSINYSKNNSITPDDDWSLKLTISMVRDYENWIIIKVCVSLNEIISCFYCEFKLCELKLVV